MQMKTKTFFIALMIAGTFACAQKEEVQRPNILFCIADDASFPHMGAYGCDWVKTPGFDKVAERGLLFTNAYTPNAKCAPSRSCIITGLNSWQLEEAANHWPEFPEKFASYVEILGENGYATGFTGKGWAPGLPGTRNGTPRELTGPAFQQKRLVPPTSKISNIDYSGNFNDFIASVPADKPWCFWYGGHEPHRYYEYGSGVALGGKQTSEIDKVPDFWPDTEVVRNDMLDYAFEIEHFDLHLQKILAMLEENGQLENTIVVVTADNGMPFPRVKGQEYEMSNHLPLAIMWPKGIKKPGRKIESLVSFIDFAPTFLDVAGVNAQEVGMQVPQGKSLTDIFRAESEGQITDREFVLIGKERHDVGRPNDLGYPIRGIVKGGYLYVKNYEPERWPAGNPEMGYLNTDGGATKTEILNLRRSGENTEFWQWNFGKRPDEELYKISTDPDCLNNLIADPNSVSVKNELSGLMVKNLREQKDPRVLGNGQIFDTYKYADEKTKDFYNRVMAGEKLDAPWVNESDFESGPLDDEGKPIKK